MRGELPDDYESAFTDQFERTFASNSGDVFVDVGAHCGTWTVRLARLFQHVVAFEPHPVNYEELVRFAPSNVTTVRAGLSRRSGKALLFLYDTPGHSAIDGSPVMVGVASSGQIEIETKALDEQTLPGRLSLLKIDTEGHEIEVLEGAIKTLMSDRPCLCIENHSLELRRRTIEILSDNGLRVDVWPPDRHWTTAGYCIRLDRKDLK